MIISVNRLRSKEIQEQWDFVIFQNYTAKIEVLCCGYSIYKRIPPKRIWTLDVEWDVYNDRKSKIIQSEVPPIPDDVIEEVRNDVISNIVVGMWNKP